MIPEEVAQALDDNGYNVIRPIGKGGYSECYLVFSRKYKMHFACKVITITDYSAFNQRRMSYQAELDSLSQIMHPNIIHIYNTFTIGNRIFLILEYCSRGDMEKLIKKQGPLTDPRKLYTYLQMMLKSLTYLEEINIAHNDIKPANFLIDEYGRIKLTDFGLSKRMTTDKDTSMNFVGSLPFMSPEVVSHKPYHPIKSDVWSFGASLYYLYTGTLPFISKSYTEWRKAIKTGLYSLPPNVDKTVKLILERCLIIDPNQRASFHELSIIVDTALSSVPTERVALPALHKTFSAKSTGTFKKISRLRPNLKSFSSKF